MSVRLRRAISYLLAAAAAGWFLAQAVGADEAEPVLEAEEAAEGTEEPVPEVDSGKIEIDPSNGDTELEAEADIAEAQITAEETDAEEADASEDQDENEDEDEDEDEEDDIKDTFIPTESISEDYAAPFPVDI